MNYKTAGCKSNKFVRKF